MTKKTSCILAFFIFILSFDSFAQNTIILPSAIQYAKKQTPPITSQTSWDEKTIRETNQLQVIDLLKYKQNQVLVIEKAGDPNQTSLSIRGFGGNAATNSLIVVDGFPLWQASLLSPSLSGANFLDINQIQILQGSFGSLYGDQAVGGVVIIETHHNKKNQFESAFSLGNLNANQEHAAWYANTPASYFFKFLIDRSQSPEFREHQLQKNMNISSELNFQKIQNALRISVANQNRQTFLAGGLTPTQYHNNSNTTTDFTSENHFHIQQLHLRGVHQFNSNLDFMIYLGEDDTTIHGYQSGYFSRLDRLQQFRPQMIFHDNKLKIISGYDIYKGNLSLNNFNPSSGYSLEQAIFSQLTWKLIPHWQLTLGSRLAQQDAKLERQQSSVENHHHAFVSEQGITWQINSIFSLFLRHDTNFRFVKLNEMSTVSQNILLPQLGDSIETGWQYKKNQAIVNFYFYRLGIHDEIGFNPTPSQNSPFGSFNNLPDTLRQGFHLNLFYRINPHWHIQTQHDFVNAEFTEGAFQHKKIPEVPRITQLFQLGYDINDEWKILYAVKTQSSRYLADDIHNAMRPMPGFAIHNLNLSWEKKNILCSLEVDNIFNRIYLSDGSYDDSSGKILYYPGTGRQITFSTRFYLN